jgi:hypothetical protein
MKQITKKHKEYLKRITDIALRKRVKNERSKNEKAKE